MFKISTTYRIYSRACCNFAFPNPPGRPMPAKKENVTESELDGIDVEDETALENPKEINNDYIQKIQYALKYLQTMPMISSNQMVLTYIVQNS